METLQTVHVVVDGVEYPIEPGRWTGGHLRKGFGATLDGGLWLVGRDKMLAYVEKDDIVELYEDGAEFITR